MRDKHHQQDGLRSHRAEIQRFLSGPQGGDQQIAARIACNEIDLLLFFRDPLNPKSHETANDMNLLRLCDMHNIPVATNIATAEMLIHGWSGAIWIGGICCGIDFPIAKPAGSRYNNLYAAVTRDE